MALLDNLISYWALDESSGDRADSHGSNTLTDNGPVGSATGKLGLAASFSGITNYSLSRADNASLSTGDIDFTAQAWVYFTTKTNYHVFAHKGWETGGSSNKEWVLWYDQGADRFVFSVAKSGADTSVTAGNFGAPSINTWYLLHGWHDSINNQIGISVNAGTANTTTHTTGVNDGASNFEVGASSVQALWLSGRVDEVGFWKRVLSSQDRTDLYNSGAGLAYPFGAVTRLMRRWRATQARDASLFPSLFDRRFVAPAIATPVARLPKRRGVVVGPLPFLLPGSTRAVLPANTPAVTVPIVPARRSTEATGSALAAPVCQRSRLPRFTPPAMPALAPRRASVSLLRTALPAVSQRRRPVAPAPAIPLPIVGAKRSTQCQEPKLIPLAPKRRTLPRDGVAVLAPIPPRICDTYVLDGVIDDTYVIDLVQEDRYLVEC